MGVVPGELTAAFAAAFGGDPTHRSRAPGRVNLLGEHLDYNDLPVLPVALARAVHVAFRPRDDETVRLVNVDPRFEPVELEVTPVVEQGPPGHWGNYPRAAARELARRFALYRGVDAVVASDLPVAAGLSSSSALTNAVGLALAHVGRVEVGPLEMAGIMADAERWTGTRGGGMDQAVSLCARSGHAVRIDFRPLRVRHHMLPEDWRFVVADTGVAAEKSGAAQAAYNLRRQECAEALEHLGAALLRAGTVAETPAGYPELIRALGGHEAALQAGERHLRGAHRKRFRHVVSEAARVEAARDALLLADATAFGDLMNASHASLRTDFLVSSAELDGLAAQALEGGARGARLTGAGFGGAIVALADVGSVDALVAALRAHPPPPARDQPPEDRVFVVRPGGGAGVERLAT